MVDKRDKVPLKKTRSMQHRIKKNFASQKTIHRKRKINSLTHMKLDVPTSYTTSERKNKFPPVRKK